MNRDIDRKTFEMLGLSKTRYTGITKIIKEAKKQSVEIDLFDIIDAETKGIIYARMIPLPDGGEERAYTLI